MPGAVVVVVAPQGPAAPDVANVPEWLMKGMRDEDIDSSFEGEVPKPPPRWSAVDLGGAGPVEAYEPPAPRPALQTPVPAGPEATAPESPKLSDVGGFDFRASFGYATVPLGNATFSGNGIPAGGIERKSFTATGDALGLHSTPFLTWELGASYVRRFLSIGLVIGGGGAPRGAQQAPLDPALASQFDPGRMIMFEGATEFSAVLFRDPAIFRLGAVVGARYVAGPLLGFENETCTSRRLPCAPEADTTVALLQPRASLDFALGHGARVAALGAYVGVDAYPEAAWSFGLSVSFLTPHWHLAP
jgi:hypothetical protein